MHTTINDMYGGQEDLTGFKNLSGLDPLDDRAATIAQQIYEGTFEGDIDPAMVALVAEKLKEAITEGYGKTIADVDYHSPDHEMLRNLERNVYQFSAAKNYQQLKAMTLAVMDGDRVRTWKDFREAAEGINNQYNKVWLQTEYNAAVASSQMASRWASFEDDDVLEYVTVGDEQVRQSHQLLDGIRRKRTDSFWNIYFPPNGWGCRCDTTVVSGRGVEETKDIGNRQPKIDPMWRTNTAKDGLVFPAGHPYYKGVPKKVLKDEATLIRARETNIKYDKWIKDNIKGGDDYLKLHNIKEGNLVVSRKSYKNILKHFVLNDKDQITKIDFSQYQYKTEAVLDETKENYKEKVERGVKSFRYYTRMEGRSEFVLNTEVYDGYEKPYAIIIKHK